MKVTGTDKEFSDYVQKFILDKGHEVEAKARPIAEKIIDDDLFPITGSETIEGLNLLASYDGLTMLYDDGFEHKQWNQTKIDLMEESGELLPEFYWQLEHQLLVCNGNKTMFVMSDGTEDNWFQKDYYSVPERRSKLIAGWKQFRKDLETFEPIHEEIKPEAKTIESLPALLVQLKGEVTNSNLELYKSTALAFIENINTELATDKDFVQAEAMVKFCKNAESELDATKKQALAQTASIDELFKTVDFLQEELRKKRLYLDKLVKSKKVELKTNIINTANSDFTAHLSEINAELNQVVMPPVITNFNMVIKNKRTISSIKNAVDTELARAKIEADQIATNIRKNLACLEKNKEYKFLFNDLQTLIVKAHDDFSNTIELRVGNHKAEERRKLEAERERIRQEEERKAQAKVEAEREAIRKEEQRKLEEEQAAIAQKQMQEAEEKRQANERIEKAKQDTEGNKEKTLQTVLADALDEAFDIPIGSGLMIEEEGEAYVKEEFQKHFGQKENIASHEQEEHFMRVNEKVISWICDFGIDIETAVEIVGFIQAGEAPHLTINY